MPDLGDLTEFLVEGGEEDTKVSDLEWLCPDPDAYREQQPLPRQNLDSIPELEEQWRYLSEEDRYRLSPENRMPSAPNTPFWAERDVPGTLKQEQAVEILSDFLRSNLQKGVTAKTALQLVRKNFDKGVIKAASSQIQQALQERGLLGSVYVDSSLFPNCQSGEGQDLVRQKNASAQFVIAKDACTDCRWASEGKCSRFDKRLVFDVAQINYDLNLWERYKSRALAQDKDLNVVKASSYKERIRQANLAPQRAQAPRLDGKPVQADVTSHISSEDASAALKATEVRSEIVTNKYREDKIRRYALQMLQGNHGPEMKAALEADADLEPLKPHLHLMGNLYADLSYFPTRQAADEYLEENPSVIAYGTPADEKVASAGDFSLKRRDVVSQIVYRYALQKFGPDHDQNIMAKIASRLFKMSEQRLRRFASSVYSKPVPQRVKKYDHLSPVIYDPTQGITSREAFKALREAKTERLKVEDTYVKKARKALMFRMALGHHTEDLKKRIAGEGFRDLLAHWKLNGFQYLITDPFTKSEIIQLERKRPVLKTIPKVSFEDFEDFLNSDDFRGRVLNRYAKIHAASSGRPVTASFKKRFASLKAEDVFEMAGFLFNQNLPKEKAQYQAYGQHYDPTGGLSLSEANQVLANAEGLDFTDALRRKTMARLLEGDNGPALRMMVASEPCLRDLKPHLGLAGRAYVPGSFFDSEELGQRYAVSMGLPYVPAGDEPFESPEVIQKTLGILRQAGMDLSYDKVLNLSVSKRAALLSKAAQKLDRVRVDLSNSLEVQVREAKAPKVALDIERGKRYYGGELDLSKEASDPTPQQIQDFKERLKSKSGPGRVAYDLKAMAKRDGGKDLVGLMKDRFGLNVVSSVYFPSSKVSTSLQDQLSSKDYQQQIVATLIDPDFKPSGYDRSFVLPEFYQTKVGRWLRDELSQGSYGRALSQKIARHLKPEEIVKNAHIILAMREEEGLYGRSYVDSSAFEDCRVGKRAMHSSVSQVLASDKCSGCMYNRQGSCLLYTRPLRKKALYDEDSLRKVLSHRISKGQLNYRDAEALYHAGLDNRERVRKANTMISSLTETRDSQSQYKGHYGSVEETSDVENRVIAMLKEARSILLEGKGRDETLQALRARYGDRVVKMGSVYLDQVFERTLHSMEDYVDDSTLNAPSGFIQMASMELTPDHVTDSLSSLDLSEPEKKESLDITFDGFTE